MVKAKPHVKAVALRAYARYGTITKACKVAGIARWTFHRWIKEDEKFARKFEAAKEVVVERYEAEAQRRALEGVEKLKFDKDGAALKDPRTGEYYIERTYSDTLLIFMLKALDQDKYRERIENINRDIPVTDKDAEEFARRYGIERGEDIFKGKADDETKQPE